MRSMKQTIFMYIISYFSKLVGSNKPNKLNILHYCQIISQEMTNVFNDRSIKLFAILKLKMHAKLITMPATRL